MSFHCKVVWGHSQSTILQNLVFHELCRGGGHRSVSHMSWVVPFFRYLLGSTLVLGVGLVILSIMRLPQNLFSDKSQKYPYNFDFWEMSGSQYFSENPEIFRNSYDMLKKSQTFSKICDIFNEGSWTSIY